MIIRCLGGISSNIENLVLWAYGSESQIRDNPPEADHNQMSWGIGKLE